MFNSILVAIDGSEHARKAVSLSGDLAMLYDARVTVVHVRRVGPVSAELRRFAEVEHLTGHSGLDEQRQSGFPPEMVAFMREADNNTDLAQALITVAQQMLDSAAQSLRDKGIADVRTDLLDGDPAEQILAAAVAHNADLVTLGSRGLGNLRGLLLGSVSGRVSQLAECTCITVK